MLRYHTRQQARLLAGICLLSLTLISCTAPQRPDPPVTQPTTAEDIAADATLAMQQQAYAKAADLFRQLAAQQTGTQRNISLLRSADAELLADNSNVQWVRNTLQTLARAEFNDPNTLLLQVLQLELAVLDKQPEPIQWNLQARLPNKSSDPALRKRFFQALISLRSGLRLRAEALAGAERWITESTERLAIQQELLHNLNQLGSTALQSYQQQHDLAGWAALARLSQQFTADLTGFRAALPAWQAQFPDHPALLEPLLEHWQTWFPTPPKIPQRIAVLLPQDERYQTVSKVIRAGILHQSASWPPEQQPTIQFYDSSQAIPVVYQQAVADGADWVIGPLRKSAVAALLPLADLSVPVLALNQASLPDGVPPSRLFFISLNPEDEARQVATRLWSEQHRHPAILAPNNTWGQRLATAFQAHWSEFSEIPLAIAYYDPATFDHSTAINQLLLSDQSHARHKKLQTWLRRELVFNPRRRADIDAIFLIAREAQAQGFAPQLKFHFAGDLPLYATSHIWQGELSQRQLADMRGIRVPDMPFFATPDALAQILDATPDQQLAYIRLFALGMDALGILPHMPRLQSDTEALWTGTSGTLSLSDQHHIERQLTWLQLDDPIKHIPPITTPAQPQEIPDGP
jgi:outer membrane PBP1 activator LpoA protein